MDHVLVECPTKPSKETIALYEQNKKAWPSTNMYTTPKRILDEIHRLYPLLKKKTAAKYQTWQNKYDLLFAKKILVDTQSQPAEVKCAFTFSRFSFGLCDFSTKDEPTLFLMEFSRYLKQKMLAAADAKTE
jgi:hypothetical protein